MYHHNLHVSWIFGLNDLLNHPWPILDLSLAHSQSSMVHPQFVPSPSLGWYLYIRQKCLYIKKHSNNLY